MKNEHEDWKAGPRVEELGYEKNRKYSQSFGSESVCSLSMTTSRIEMARKMATAPKGEIFHVSNFIHSQRFRVSSLPPSLPPSLSLSLSLSLICLLPFFLSCRCTHENVLVRRRNVRVGTVESICYSGEQVLGPITEDPVTRRSSGGCTTNRNGKIISMKWHSILGETSVFLWRGIDQPNES